MRRARVRRAAAGAVAARAAMLAAVLAAAGAVGSGPAGAQAEPFAPLETVVRPPSGPVLFFPLADEFETCLPLSGPCPEGSSALVLVAARGRRLAWSPEGAELPAADGSGPPLPAVGSPPPEPERARYLVPLIDGGTPGLRFAARRLEGAELVAATSGEGTAVVPALAGPVLPAGSPQGLASERMLGAPRVVDAAELAEAVPVLVVRRAAPSRVAFGVLPDPTWALGGTDVVPLVGRDSVAVLARHNGEVGLATAAPEDAEVPGDGDGDGEGEGGGGGGSGGGDGRGDDDGGAAVVAAAAGAAVVAAGALGAVAVRRRRRRAAGPGRPVI